MISVCEERVMSKEQRNMTIAIVKYNAGNIYSVYCACKRLGYEAVITDDPATLRAADKVIFPGVGEARAAMDHLNATRFPVQMPDGTMGEETLADVIRSLCQPVLGICIGMQLMCRHSEEGDVDCLGIFDAPVIRFRPGDLTLKVPQMGWNTVEAEGPLFQGIPAGSYFYYVHSYHVPLCTDTIGVTEYGCRYSAALHKDNFWATQFHPEKSGPVGEQLIRNFLEM